MSCSFVCSSVYLLLVSWGCSFLTLSSKRTTHVTILFRGGMIKTIGAFGVSYLIGAKVHSGRIAKKMKTKHLKDQKALYTQYYNDVYKLEEQKAEQQAVIEQLQAALA